ncbi:hypothetical protein PybrP1_005593 [[Pythium] brassicae (nom. inval.)]|nr:hypothetical protein PybrP1_005593 [[Pythium] brassicae (nom. inval.)]
MPEAAEQLHPYHSMVDFLSPLRLSCRPLQWFAAQAGGPQRRQRPRPRAKRRTVLRLSLSDSYGALAFAHTKCITRSVNFVSDTAEHEMCSRIAFEADVSCANLVLASALYTGEPHFSGADSLSVTVVNTKTLASDAVVAKVNDAPYLVSGADIYKCDEDVPLVVCEFLIVDPDAPADNALIRVVLRAALVSLALLEEPLSLFVAAVTATVVADGRDELRVPGTLQDVNRALAALVYTSTCDWNSADSTFDDSTSDG